jgi:hypothetical protein
LGSTSLTVSNSNTLFTFSDLIRVLYALVVYMLKTGDSVRTDSEKGRSVDGAEMVVTSEKAEFLEM